VNDKTSFSLFRDPERNLVFVNAQGNRFVNVEPVHMFPITDPGRWISICDAEAIELICIEDLENLAPDVRKVLEEELEVREFLPIIRKIIKLSTKTEPSEWVVETDRGRTQFTVKDEDDVHRLGGGRMLIIDAHGTRYLIPNANRLDSASRKNLAYFM
jgi:hypothetical protein